MNHQATQLLIKLGLDADLHKRFTVNPDLVMDELGLDLESKSQIENLSSMNFSKNCAKNNVQDYIKPFFIGIGKQYVQE